MTSYAYHTISTLYEELSKLPQTAYIKLSEPKPIFVSFPNNVQKYVLVSFDKKWNNLEFSSKKEKVSDILPVLEKYLKSHGDSTVTCDVSLLKKDIYFTFDVLSLRWAETHLNNEPNVKKLKEEYQSLIKILGDNNNNNNTLGNMTEIKYSWLNKKLGTTSVYCIGSEVYFDEESLFEEYSLLKDSMLKKLFVAHETYTKLNLCKLSVEEMRQFSLDLVISALQDKVQKL